MGLFSRDQDEDAVAKETRLRSLYEAGVDAERNTSALDRTLGPFITDRARRLSQQAQQDISRGSGNVDDLASVAESLESVYAIAKKLDEIDRTVDDASAGLLHLRLNGYQHFHDYRSRVDEDFDYETTEAAIWREIVGDQIAMLGEWATALERPAKRSWFLGILEVRAQVFDSFLQAYGHVQELRRDMAFLHAAPRAAALLPEFSLADARTELLTTEGEARKAQELADHVAGASELELLGAPLLADVELPAPAVTREPDIALEPAEIPAAEH